MTETENVAVQAGRKVTTHRRENLHYLVVTHGSQAALASSIPSSLLTQPMISTILRKKRPLWPHEARAIENDLKIPEYWLDRYSLRLAWKQLRRFRELPQDAVSLLNEMLVFVEAQARSSAASK